MQTHPVHLTFAAALTLAFSLTACGGGGAAGGAASADTAGRVGAPATAAALTVSALVPSATMDWATAGHKAVALDVLTADGQPAAGAAVRVFTLSRSSPQDGTALAEPVPVSLLDTVVTDAAGQARLALQWPGHVGELLVVATLDDTQGRTVLSANGGAAAGLQLAR